MGFGSAGGTACAELYSNACACLCVCVWGGGGGGRPPQGTWNMGKKEGEGTYNTGDGGVYAGGFLQDQYHGMGTFRYPNGDVYEGEWFCGACCAQVVRMLVCGWVAKWVCGA